MRLQLIGIAVAVAIALIASAAAPAVAQVADTEPGDGTAEATVGVYADDDETTVITSLVNGSVRLPVPVVVSAHALVDAVSSASVDVVSAATSRWDENRIELGADAAIRAAGTDATIGYTTSGENDWRSHSIEVGLARELARKNTTIALGYGFTHNRVGRAEDPTFADELVVHGGQLALTQVLGERTLGSIAYTVQRSTGYHASPYRYVTAADGTSRPETHPDERLRHAVTVRVLRAIGGATSIDAQYRIYADDWGIASHTVTAAIAHELTDSIDLRVRGRGYYQGRAAFYRETYEMPMQYMTADRELSTFWDAGGGVRLAWHGEHVEVSAKADAIYYRFLDYARLAGRVAVVTGGGLTWRW
jgi:hypothetical protein